ncbi:MAG TPA: PD-(D/E)XK nuclease family protein [Candidatus Nanoarchaeia archaeon]|nr:PD-(D/E)XK nuclease family protein [Candidatus Nanoarchaeia archaeon]
MEIKKEDKKKITFNLSPSSLNTFYQSPLLFYLTYIAKVPDDTKVPVCYSLSGNIVHDCLEKYANKELDKEQACIFLLEKWSENNLDIHKDIKGNVLNPEEYLSAMLEGLRIVDQHEAHVAEETISFPLKENEEMKIGIKGIIDLQAKHKESSEFVLIDYKTSNSVSRNENFERQALFYNLLLHKKKQIIPSKTTFHYLKLGISKDYSFDITDIEAFNEELEIVVNQLLEYGTDIRKYPLGNIDDVFNSKKQACLREMEMRKRIENQDFSRELEGHFI